MKQIIEALLKDMQVDLDNIKKSESQSEVLNKLHTFKDNIDTTIKLILKEN